LREVVAQAVRLQPFDGRVRFDAGRQVHLAGDVPTAFEHYRASIRMPGSHRQRLVLLLARVLPAAVFVAELDPDCAATDLVLAAYREAGGEEDLVAIAEHAEQATISESGTLTTRDSARRWRQVSVVNRSLKRYDKAIECATRAYELCPNDFWVRFDLAFAYYDSGAYAQADPHLRWCLSRRPDIRYLQQSLQLAAKRRLEMGSAERMRTTARFLISRRQSASEPDSTSPPETVAK
jgi:tetratricopeptide (TPR) repeat protein